MTLSIYQNARIQYIRHFPEQDALVVGFEGLPERRFDCVVDFSFNGFYPHNILFGIDEYTMHNLPARIAAEYPVLSYYLHSGEEWQVFHFSPQVGLGGIVVCAVL